MAPRRSPASRNQLLAVALRLAEYAQALRSLSPHAFPALTRFMDVLENNGTTTTTNGISVFLS